MNKQVAMTLITVLTLVSGTRFLVSDNVIGAARLTLTADFIEKAPTGLDDPVWDKAKSIEIPLEGKDNFAGMKKTVITRAVYTNDEIYFLFNPGNSTVRRGAIKRVTKTVSPFCSRLPGSRISLRKGAPPPATAHIDILPAITSSPQELRERGVICGIGRRLDPLLTIALTTIG